MAIRSDISLADAGCTKDYSTWGLSISSPQPYKERSPQLPSSRRRRVLRLLPGRGFFIADDLRV